MSRNGQIGTVDEPLSHALANDGYLAGEKRTTDPPAVPRRWWFRVDQNQLRYYDEGGTLNKVPLKTSVPAAPYATVTTDGGATYYINLESKASADHPNLAVDGAIGDGLAMTGVALQTVDDWEDQDLVEYTEYSGNGSTSFGFATGSAAEEGDYALQSNEDQSGIYSRSGLPNYPAPGDTFRWEHDVNDGFGRTLWGVPSNPFSAGYYTPDGYSVDFKPTDDTVNLAKVDDGGNTNLDSDTSVSIGSGEYQIEVEWATDGTMNVDVIDKSNDTVVTSLSGKDTQYGSGGVGMAANSASGDVEVTWDYYVIL